jgi:hypothetical protein
MRKLSLVSAAVCAALAAAGADALTPTAIHNDLGVPGTLTIVNMVGSSALRDQFQATLKTVCTAGTSDEYGIDDSNGAVAGGVGAVPHNAWDGNVPAGITLAAGKTVSYNGPDFRAYSCKLAAGPFAAAPALNPLGGSDVLIYYRSEGGSGFGVVGAAKAAAKLSVLNILSLAGGAGTDANSNCTKWVAGASEWGPTGIGTGFVFGSNGYTSTATSGVFQNWVCPVPAPIYNTNNALDPTLASNATFAGNNNFPAAGTSGWFLPLDEAVTVTVAATCTGGPPCNPTTTGNAAGTFTQVWTVPASGFPSDLALTLADGSNAQVHLGVADVEPQIFTGENYPKNYKAGDGTAFLTGLTAAQAASITGTAVIQQLFGVVYNTTGANAKFIPAAGLSAATLRGIFSGQYTDWSHVPELVGTAAPGGAITVCRRDPTSGTQAQSSIIFNNQFCGSKSALENALGWTVPNGTTVQMYATSTDVEGCVAASDSIGIRAYTGSLKTPGIAFMAIDGNLPSQGAMQTGGYRDWVEATYVEGTTFAGLTANQQSLITGLVQFTSDATSGTIAAGSAYLYIPGAKNSQGNDNNPGPAPGIGTAAAVAGHLGLTSKSTAGVGDSCKQTPAPQN